MYPDLSYCDEQLTYAFRHYKYYFPEKNIPRVVGFISGFNYAVVSTDSVLGIGLDMYLGKDSEYYPALQLPNYKIVRMRKEYLAADAMRGWAQSEWEMDAAQSDLLSAMIYQGKHLYFLDMMMPRVHDTIKTGYTLSQLNWCVANEQRVWSFFIEQKLLFSSDQVAISKFVNDGPTTNGFPKESPADMAQWIGREIIRSYMNSRSGISFSQLMLNNDYKKIFNESKYKPKK
jgi:hypothetical protein